VSNILVICSYYRGIPPYTDISTNLRMAERIMREQYADSPEVVLCLPLLWSWLGEVPPENVAVHEAACNWCLQLITLADEVHFHLPADGEWSPGMKGELEFVKHLEISNEIWEWSEWGDDGA
jgi:hypothetical protein